MVEEKKKHFKLGRHSRTFDSRIPQIDTIRHGSGLPPLPATVDYASGLPANLGMMLNDTLGDCTCAAVGHSEQIWTSNTQSTMVTPTDDQIEQLYEAVGGYIPGNPNTDNGANEQVVLSYWLNNPVDNNKLTAFIEINQADMANVKRCVWECGVVYIGFNVPNYLMENLTAPGSIWDVDPNGDNSSAGGHAVIIVGYLPNGNLILVSWGSVYYMTPAFWNAQVDEAYALVNQDWVEKTGLTPAGLNISQLEALMAPMQFNQPDGNHRQKKHRRQHRRRNRQAWLAAQ